MKVRHEITLRSTCPVNGDADVYKCWVYVDDRVLTCEEVAETAATLTQGRVFQEDLTQKMADALKATVKTQGMHTAGGILTTIVCRPRPVMTDHELRRHLVTQTIRLVYAHLRDTYAYSRASINDGYCNFFASDVDRLLTFVRPRWASGHVLHPVGSHTGDHCFLELVDNYEPVYFDSECEEGTTDWCKLPFFVRQRGHS